MTLQLIGLLGIVAIVYRREHRRYRRHMALTHREIATRLYPRSGTVQASTTNKPRHRVSGPRHDPGD